MPKPPFNAGHFIQDVIYGATPWGIVDNALGNPLPRMHLSRVDSAAEDVTATVDPNDPNNHEISPISRMFMGLKPDMKARDLQNDRARFYNTEDGKTLERAGATTGYQAMDQDNKYKNTQSLRGDISRAAPNIQTLQDEEVTYSQLGLKNAGTGADGNPVTPTTITQIAQRFKNLKQVNAQLNQLGVVPKAGATYPELQLQLKEAKVKDQRDAARIADEIEFGTPGEKGAPNVGGTQGGRIKLEQADDASKASKASVRASDQSVAASKAATELNSVIAKNNQINQLNADDWNKYVHGDGKREAQIDRDHQADREDAKFAADNANIRSQNAAEMERYELMLENDRQVRQSDSIVDLMSALTFLSGSFGL